jgi:cytoskeletal protein CcmA (bactofilin family)
MSLKNNFYQALRELLNGEESAGSEHKKEATESPSDPDFHSGTEQAAADAGAPYFAGKGIDAEPAVKPANKDSSTSASSWKNPFMRETSFNKQPEASSSAQDSFQQINEMTIISKNTVIIGDIRSLANVTIEGNVRGKVDVLKDATMQGMLVGDLTCKNAKMQGSSVQGNVLTKENAYIDNNSTVLGSLAAQNASIDGKIKGNIEIGSKVEFHENAIVAGDIYTNTITVADGANIKGFVNTAFLSENSDAAFPSQIVIDEDLNLSLS